MTTLLTTIARNSFFGAFGKLSIKAISFLFTIFIIRWLGDEAYGQYLLVWSYVLIFSMLSDVGLSTYAVREIAKKKSHSSTITANTIAIRIILSLLTIALIMITARLLGYSDQFLQYTFLASLCLPLYAIQDPLDTVLQAEERFDLATAAVIAGHFFFVCAGAIFLILGWHITGLIIAALLNVIISMLLAWRFLKNYRGHLKWQINPNLWPIFIRTSIPFGIIKLWLNWSLKIDTIILAWFWTDQMVGWYGAAYVIITGVLVIPNSINTALYPTLTRQYQQNIERLPEIYELILKYLLMISLPIVGGIFLTADKWVNLLFGPEFAPTAQVLAILIWVVPFAFISEFLRYILLITGRERIAAQALGVVVLFNLIFNLWLIPRYGLVAATIIVIITEALLVLLYTRQLNTELELFNFTNTLLKPIVATLILMVVVYFSSPFLFVQILLGGLAYITAIWLLRTLKPNEYTFLFNLIKNSQKVADGLSKK